MKTEKQIAAAAAAYAERWQGKGYEKGADFIDGYITPTKVLIELKGSHIDLAAKAKQSDNIELAPYQQARRYAEGNQQTK